MGEASDWRCRNGSLVFACRTVEERFGPKAVEMLARHHHDRIVAAFREKAAAMGRNDIAALATLFGAHPETHTYELVRQDERTLEYRITRCAHAEEFARWGACDIGLRFMCAGDEAMIEGFNPRISLERPKLLMRGDDCCHFIYRLKD